MTKKLTVNRSIASALSSCIWFRAFCFVRANFKSGRVLKSKVEALLAEHFSKAQISQFIDDWYINGLARDFSVRFSGDYLTEIDPVLYLVNPSKVRMGDIVDRELKPKLQGFVRTKDVVSLKFPLCLAPKPFKSFIVLGAIQSHVKSISNRQAVVVDYNVEDGSVRYVRSNLISDQSTSREILEAQKKIKRALSHKGNVLEVSEVYISQRFLAGITGFGQRRICDYIAFLKEEGLLGVETKAVVIAKKKKGSAESVSSFCAVLSDLRPRDKARLSFCVTSGKVSDLGKYDNVSFAAKELEGLDPDCEVHFAVFTSSYLVLTASDVKKAPKTKKCAFLPYPTKKFKRRRKTLA